jgi:CyaY protein
MNDSEYHQKVAETMALIEEAIDASGADIDYETVSDILTLEFADRSKIIINKQTAAHQVWVAAKSGGFHFDYDADNDRWVDKGSGAELIAELSRLASLQAGEEVRLQA